MPDITMVSPVFVERPAGRLRREHRASFRYRRDGAGQRVGEFGQHLPGRVRIPLGRICRAGELVQEMYDFMILNTRTPVERGGDLHAQIASNIAGAKRLGEVVQKYGADYFAECTDAALDYAERLMRAGIRTAPEGTYTFEDYLDDAGANSSEPIAIRAAITIEDGTAKVDFTGTSPQVPGPLNMTYSGSLTTVFYCFKAVAGQSILANHGIYRALQVTAPEGSIVNCRSPVPVGQRIDTAQRVVDVILGALAQVAPERVLAACNSVVTSAIFSGTNPKTGGYFVYLETIAGGSGAHSRGDGLSGVQVHMTNTSNLPVEALEREYPVLVERYQARTDSGGAGRFRGGLGIRRDFRILTDGMSYTGLGDRHKFSPWGLEGGRNGSPGSFWASLGGDELERLGSKISGVTLNREDLVSVCSPGSGDTETLTGVRRRRC
ncbi:hydantoinase B/oxoprolinase family protein [Paenibacillus sp. P26]|nr:hydantoinase B/oxoprolinase family protein [Paenibacillus sp. P26]